MVIFSRLIDALQGLDLGAPWGDQQRFVAWVRSGGRALSVAALFHPVTQRHAGWLSVVDEKWLRPPDYEGRDGLLLADAVFRVGLMLGSLPNAADKMAA